MRTLKGRLLLVVGLIMTSPVAALAGDPDTQETAWDWLVRFLSWAAGGWHIF
ncbi:MAG: hypothetical protein ABIG03_06965 [Candidatus Eisenbacteria bacterium]